MTVIDLYAGPGGWDEGMRNIGITDVIGVELEPNACATARAAGHARIRADVSRPPIRPGTTVHGLVASPPCQAWSMAGKRAGEQDRAKVHALIDAYAAGSNDTGTGWADHRSHHAAQPVRWVRDFHPQWVCFEQVPPVLSLWEHAAVVLRRWGYSTWTGVLNSADYGVPQTRERAVLMARLDAPVHPPVATHARTPEGADLFGGELLPWVSMAEALGWVDDVEMISNYNTGGQNGVRGHRSATDPAATMTSKAGRMKVALRNGTQANASVRPADQPAGTLFFGERLSNVSWVLHTNRDQRPDGTRQTVDPHARPAPTLTGKSGGQWQLRASAQANATAHGGDEPEPTITAGHDTAQRVWQQDEQTTRVTVQEAAILQSFPPDYPWQGTKTAQYLQVGNAIPPRLAAHIVAAVTQGATHAG
jgi:DNA (cytosine-5)-methyltransferase 1